MTEDGLDRLMPVQEEPQQAGFDVVLRGYDRRQVDDYLDRLEADLRSAAAARDEAGARLGALEFEHADLRQQFEQVRARAEQAAPTRVEIGERLTRMLALAEEEAAEVRAAATEEADRLVRLAAEDAERTREEARRSAAAATAAQEEAAARVEQELAARRQEATAQAQALLESAARDAEQTRTSAREDAERLVGEATAEATARREQADAQVAALAAQRDAIAAELTRLRDHLASATASLTPLSVPAPAGDDLSGATGAGADDDPTDTAVGRADTGPA